MELNMKNKLSNLANPRSTQSTSFAATIFGVVVTALLVGGYEAAQLDTFGDVAQANTPAPAVVRMEPMVVTAQRI
jgi:hypothetical protein